MDIKPPSNDEITRLIDENVRKYLFEKMEKKKFKTSELYDLWAHMFFQYNEQNDPKLSMRCRPCYHKVYEFIINKANPLRSGKDLNTQGI